MIGLLALLIGCADPGENVHDGIAVGNPGGTMRFALSPADEITFDPATLAVSTLYLETCDGEIGWVPIDAEVGLQGDTPIDVPSGTFCLVAFTLARPVALSGAGDNGGTFAFRADIGRIRMGGEVYVPPSTDPTRDLVLEVAQPGWVSQRVLGLQADAHLDIGPACDENPLCIRMRRALADQSAIYEDAGADGRVDEPERERGTEAEGSDRGR